VAAGLYNLAWGLYSAVDSQWLFRLARMPLLNHPAVFACLGMVVGLYGLLYLEVARVPGAAGSWPRWGCWERCSGEPAKRPRARLDMWSGQGYPSPFTGARP
jgi:hypothetical protein